MRFDGNRRRVRGAKGRAAATYVTCVLVTFIGITATYLAAPSLREHFVREDDLLENLTAGLHFAAFLFAAIGASRTAPGARRRLGPAVAVLGLFAFLDEVSYGAGYFLYRPPRLLGVRIDALHDLVEVAYANPQIFSSLLEAVLGLGVVMGGGGIVFSRRLRSALREFFSLPEAVFLLAFAAFGILSVATDLRLIHPPLAALFEEIFEFEASLALFFAAGASWRA